MKIVKTPIEGLFEIDLEPHSDPRGAFIRTFCKQELAETGFNSEIVQINHSISKYRGTFRGFHFQHPPFSEVKIVRCLKGNVMDMVIDLRKESKTFLKNYQLELSEDNFKMLFIPAGMAHGFQTLADNSQLLYMHSEFYKPEYEDGILFNDPVINIDLPLPVTEISDRDKSFYYMFSNFKCI